MIEEKNNKKNKVIRGIAILGLFLMVFGISYALFKVTLNGKKTNKIKTAKFDVRLTTTDGTEEKDLPDGVMGINLEGSNAVPMSQEEGMTLEPYKFVVQNRGSVEASYKLTLEDIEGITNTLDDQYIRYNLVRKDYYDYREYHEGDFSNGYYSTENDIQADADHRRLGRMAPLLSNTENRILDETTLMPNECIEYTLNLWIDEEATTEQASDKEFSAKIKIDATQASVYTKGYIGDADYTLYKDGTIIFTGEGAISGLDVGTMAINDNVNAFIDIVYNRLIQEGLNIPEIIDFNSGWDNYSVLAEVITNYDIHYDDYGYDHLHHSDIKGNAGYFSDKDELYDTVIETVQTIPMINRVVVGEGITKIGSGQLINLHEVMISLPNTLETIDIESFSYFNFLNIPESVTHIYSGAIITNLDTVRVNNSKEYVDNNWDAGWITSDEKVLYLK